MTQVNPLRGAVAQRYGSCQQFAEKLKWSGRKARDIVSGRQIPTAKDISEMARALGLMDKPDEFMAVFFADSVHIVDDKKEEEG